jgi:predicted 3-demethylubiquinone-9 3-methyltransferase (glyoxalase superfamily)
MGLNGGPMFTINPSISLFVTCTTTHEIEEIWNLLSEGGSTMMPLDKYPWSEKYGWVIDKFGMTWQLMLGELQTFEQKIIPSLLFVGEQFGQGAEAIRKYVSLFQNSKIHHLEMAANGESDTNQHLAFGRFELNGAQFAAMDGPGNHEFQFNEGVSLVVECETQDEIDYLWDHLTRDGGVEVQCGWLCDSHGISWQIIPSMLGSLMSDPEKGERVMQKLMKMKKLDLNILLNA